MQELQISLSNVIMFRKIISTVWVLVILFNPSLSTKAIHRNNVCKNFIDYFAIDISPNCYYDSDVGAQVPDILERHVGDYESHEVTTEDGYILTLFRIPNENPKGTILFMHPLLLDSTAWVGQSKESIAFLYWRNGYDIWLANNRGTMYSQRHTNLTVDDFDYWNFTFHEIGYYDLKAEIDYITNTTSRNDLIVMGHSMGTTESFIYASLRPEEAKEKVKLFVALGPSANLNHMISPLKYSALLVPLGKVIWQLLQIGHLAGYEDISMDLYRFFSLNSPFKRQFILGENFCCGWTPFEFEPLLVNLMISQSPRAVSVKTLFHYGQLITGRGKFNMYDYGWQENMVIYGQKTPPDYPIEKIETPIFLVYSDDDYVTNTRDAEKIYNRLSDRAKTYGSYRIKGTNHIDFLYGRNRNGRIYEPILDLLNKKVFNN